MAIGQQHKVSSTETGRTVPSTESSQDVIAGSTTSLAPILTDPNDDERQSSQIKLSRRRWLVLFAISVFGFSVAITSETSSIFHLILKVLDFGNRVDYYLYINQIFYYVMAATAIPIACFVDKYGIRVALYSSSAVFFVHASFKALLFLPGVPGWSRYKIFYWIASSLFGTLMYALYFVLPLKISESWFSESERSVAWTLMISQLNLGMCIGSFLFPRILHDIPDVKILAYLNLICATISAIVILTCVTQANPKHPPNKRVVEASKDSTPFLVSFMKMLKHCDIMIHLIHLAVIESIILSVGSALQDILTSVGQTEIFAGNFMSMSALVALIMQLILASFIHRVKNVTLTCKLGSLIYVSLFVIYLIALILKQPGWLIVVIYMSFTVCKSWVLPNFTNMTAHLACGTVPQATIVGFSMTMTVIVMTVIQTSFVSLIRIHDKKNNYGNALVFLIVISLLNDAIYLIKFKGESAKTLGNSNSNQTDSQETTESP